MIKRYLDNEYDHLEYNFCDGCKKLFFDETTTAVGDAPKDARCEICGVDQDGKKEEPKEALA